MKKYIIISLAALCAMCACTKTEPNEAPLQSIDFNVASYMPQTKANSSIIGETQSFKSFAYYHVNDGVQNYFTTAGETITPDNVAEPTKWAPSKPYYWPKTGYINFYSYYGTKDPAITDGSLTYGTAAQPITVEAADNLVFADPAFNQTANLSTYKKDSVKEGVPTLFHHALAQIAFDAAVTQVTDKKSDTEEYTTWAVTIDEASLTVKNKGTLSLTKALPAATADASNPAWLDSYDVVGWNPAEGTETIGLNELKDALTVEAQTLLTARSIMPQTLGTVNTFTLTYTITTTRSWDPENPVTETITVPDLTIKSFTTATALESWNMNKKYIYHLVINPSDGQLILFDPAVEDMVKVDPAGTLEYPETTTTTTGN